MAARTGEKRKIAGEAASPEGSPEAEIRCFTDHYFLRTKEIVVRHGDQRVTYSIFMRWPICFAPRLMVSWLERIAEIRGAAVDISLCHEEGDRVEAGVPLIRLSGAMVQLVDLETLLLQRLGPACIAARNAFLMCSALP